MKKICVLVLGVLCLLPTLALAGETEAQEAHEAEMAAWMEASQPGENHEHLAKMVGHWHYTSTGPTGENKGNMHAKTILDGRFVMATWKGEFDGMEFVGYGLNGYDNIAGKYVSTWIDNFTTGIQVSHGKCTNDDCTESVSKSEMMGLDGKPMRSKAHMTWNDDDTFTLDFYMVPDEGEPTKHMQIVAKRCKCDGKCKLHDASAEEMHAHKEMMKAEMAEAEAEMKEAEGEMAEAAAEIEAAEAEMAEAEAEMAEAAEALKEAAKEKAEEMKKN